MIYKCRRCGHTEKHKGNFLKHLNRQNICKPKLENIDIETLKQELDTKKVPFCENSVKVCENSVNISGQSNNKENNQYCTIVKIINGKYQCSGCKKVFKQFKYLDEHQKKNCKMLIHHNNIYTFDTETFGKNKYGKGGGDVYIVQTDFNTNKFFKIGITTCLYNRLKHYRCGSVLEPRLHFYYPFKNIKKTDKDLKLLLYKYKVKREIYNGELEIFQNIIKEYQKSQDETEFEIEPNLKDSCNLKKCQYCNLFFFNAKSLYKHTKVCEKIETLKCCKKMKEVDIALIKELNEVNIDGIKEYKEESEMAIKEDKIAELKTERTYLCKYCSSYFSTRQSKSRHESKYCKKKLKEEHEITKKEPKLVLVKKEADVAELKMLIQTVIIQNKEEKQEMKQIIGQLKDQLDFIRNQIKILMKNVENNTIL